MFLYYQDRCGSENLIHAEVSKLLNDGIALQYPDSPGLCQPYAQVEMHNESLLGSKEESLLAIVSPDSCMFDERYGAWMTINCPCMLTAPPVADYELAMYITPADVCDNQGTTATTSMQASYDTCVPLWRNISMRVARPTSCDPSSPAQVTVYDTRDCSGPSDKLSMKLGECFSHDSWMELRIKCLDTSTVPVHQTKSRTAPALNKILGGVGMAVVSFAIALWIRFARRRALAVHYTTLEVRLCVYGCNYSFTVQHCLLLWR
jgi:hypothetical protein